MIKTENLTKTFSSGTKAVDNLNIHVEEGEIFGFLGPNGAGKSTTIKILTTLARPTSGIAWIGGYNVLTEPNKVRCSIGYVSQETGVDYFLSGRENLVLQGRLYRMDSKSIHKRVEELLELFDLKETADALVSTYSGGMRRKLDVATALIHNPKILFLDEPTIGLDKGSMKIVDTPEALKDSIKGDSINLSLSGGAKEKAITVLKESPMVKDILCEDGHVRVYVNNGSETIPGLMKLLNQQGVEILSLTISRPSLDDVYLKYSGVSFKEGESTGEANPWWAQWQKGGGGEKWASSPSNGQGGAWGSWEDKKEDKGDEKQEDAWNKDKDKDKDKDKNEEQEEAWKKWGGSTSDWEKWGKGGGKS